MTLRHKETCFDEDRPAVVPFGFDKTKAMYEDAVDFETAIATHARKLVEADDLESLIWDLYHSSTALDRFLSGKPKGGDEGSLLMLNRRLSELRLAVDGECEG